jgi:hypothetical protein
MEHTAILKLRYLAKAAKMGKRYLIEMVIDFRRYLDLMMILTYANRVIKVIILAMNAI